MASGVRYSPANTSSAISLLHRPNDVIIMIAEREAGTAPQVSEWSLCGKRRYERESQRHMAVGTAGSTGLSAPAKPAKEA